MKPELVTKDKASIGAVRNEIMGAASSMNMPPEYRDDIDQTDAFYMTDIYVWAQHAHEHCIAACHNINALYNAIDAVAWELRKKDDWENAEKLLKILNR